MQFASLFLLPSNARESNEWRVKRLPQLAKLVIRSGLKNSSSYYEFIYWKLVLLQVYSKLLLCTHFPSLPVCLCVSTSDCNHIHRLKSYLSKYFLVLDLCTEQLIRSNIFTQISIIVVFLSFNRCLAFDIILPNN